jgi:putative Mn2+ efflux pump MntP
LVLNAILLIVPLGLDTFGLAAALGMAGLPPELRRRTALVFAAFEAVMPLVGLALGAPLGHALGGVADYIAAGVVGAVGARMLLGADASEEESIAGAALLARARGAAILGLGLAISLDELAIGLAIGLLRVPVVAFVIAVGVQAFVFTQIGLRLGARLGEHLRERAERLAGGALIAVGCLLVLEQATA